MKNVKLKEMKSKNMRNLTAITTCLSLSIFFLTGCNPDKKNAESIAIDYLRAVIIYNFSEAKKYVAEDKVDSYVYYEANKKKVFLTDTTTGGTMDIDLLRNMVSDKSSYYQVVNVEIADDNLTAKVTIHIIPTYHSTLKDRTVSLKKEDGKWKVDNKIEDVMLKGRIDYSLQTGFTITE
jgi:hypothetical protein